MVRYGKLQCSSKQQELYSSLLITSIYLLFIGWGEGHPNCTSSFEVAWKRRRNSQIPNEGRQQFSWWPWPLRPRSILVDEKRRRWSGQRLFTLRWHCHNYHERISKIQIRSVSMFGLLCPDPSRMKVRTNLLPNLLIFKVQLNFILNLINCNRIFASLLSLALNFEIKELFVYIVK